MRLRRLPLIKQAGDPARKAGPAVRPLDALIIGLAAAALVALSVAVYGGPSSATLVVATDDGEWLYPLSEDRVIDVPGILGTTRVRIHDGEAHIEDSPCANKTCVAAPAISQTGEWAACLPNGVFIRIDGSGEDYAVDATVR